MQHIFDCKKMVVKIFVTQIFPINSTITSFNETFIFVL